MAIDPALSDALDDLLSGHRTGDPEQDLLAAAREALRRRISNTQSGGAVLQALHRRGLSWRQISDLTGIPTATAHRWGLDPLAPPDVTSTPDPSGGHGSGRSGPPTTSAP